MPAVVVLMEGLIGQNGSDSVNMHDVHAMAAHNNIWHQPSASRGRSRRPASAAPMLLPMPRPKRNTARISEKV